MQGTQKLILPVGVALISLMAIGSTQAKLFQSAEKAPPETSVTPSQQAATVVQAGCEQCCVPQYCIEYRQHRVRRKVCCGCCVAPLTAMLRIHDPCSCRPVEIPVCVPGCCTGAPSVSCRNGLFGRTITEYTWCCGYRVRIVLTRHNRVIVHTYGS